MFGLNPIIIVAITLGITYSVVIIYFILFMREMMNFMDDQDKRMKSGK